MSFWEWLACRQPDLYLALLYAAYPFLAEWETKCHV